MKEIIVSIDSLYFDHKPTTDEAAQITKRLTRQSGTVEDLAGELVQPKGRSWSPGVFSQDGVRNNDCWETQQVFALDADSKEATMSLTDILNRCNAYGVHPAFIYTSFSHTEETPKYRVVFVAPVAITHSRIRDVIQLALMRIFPEFDQSVKDAARMFYGGKEIVHSDYEAELNILGLFKAVTEKIRDEESTQAARNIKNWCQSVGLNTINSYPAVVEVEDETGAGIAKNVDLTTTLLSIYIDMCPNRQKLQFSLAPVEKVARGGNVKYGKIENIPTTYELIRSVDYDDLYQRCKVYRDFMDGVAVHHDVTWAIATNLVRLEGGEKKFFEGVARHPGYNAEKWKATVNYIKKVCYLPVRYDNAKIATYYPDAANSAEASSIVNTAKVKRGEIVQYMKTQTIDIDTAFNMLQNQVEKALADTSNSIYVFRGDTGLGKSTIIQGIRENMLIAVPTHDLKDQLVAEFAEKGVTVAATPRLPVDVPDGIHAALDRLYTIGASSAANKYLRNQAGKIPEIAKYLEELSTALKTQGTIVTTHARLPYTKTAHNLIVIDEDILPTIFTQSSVKVGDLIKLRDALTPSGGFGFKRKIFIEGKEIDISDDVNLMNTLIEKAMNAPEIVPNEMGALPFKYFKYIEAKAIEHRNAISGNVLSFLAATHFVRRGETLLFVTNKELPLNKKIFVFSATASETLYKKAFGDRVKFIDIPSIVITGDIVQYPVNTSRNAMKKDGIVSFAKDVTSGLPVITFKDNEKDFDDVVLTVGAVMGMNNLTGKDIAVVCTPHMPSDVYVLLACALNYRIQPHDLSQFRYTQIKRNGFEFYFSTYESDFLREIQLHLVESELVQAIGRARVNRNACKVIVISDYPVKQASIVQLTQAQQKMIRAA